MALSSISGPMFTPSSVPRPTRSAGHPLDQLRAERLGHLALHVEPVGRRARLAAVAELGLHGAFDGGVEVGVGEDQERRVATEFHRHPQYLLGALLDQLATDRGRSGEGEFAGAAVADQRFHHARRPTWSAPR